MLDKEAVESLLIEYNGLLQKKEDYLILIAENDEIINDRKVFYYEKMEYSKDNRRLKRKVTEFDDRMNEIAILFRDNDINLIECLENRTR